MTRTPREERDEDDSNGTVRYPASTSRMFSGFKSVWIRFESCKTGEEVSGLACREMRRRTSDAAKDLPCKLLDMPPREWRKLVLLEKVVKALAKQFGDDADMVPMIEPLY